MPITKQQAENIKRLERRRKKESGFMATLEFFSTAANMFCLYSDALSIFGIALILTNPIGLSIALGVTIGVAALALIAGGIWAGKQAKGYRKARKQEVQLMQDCYELENSGIILSNTPTEKVERTFWAGAKRFVSKAGNRLMSGLNGASTMLGVAGVIFGIFSIGFAPAMPVYLIAVIVGAVVLAAAFGIAYAISEYVLARSQDKNIETLTEKKQALENASTYKTMLSIKQKKKQQKSVYTKEIAALKQQLQLKSDNDQADSKVTDMGLFKQSPNQVGVNRIEVDIVINHSASK